MGLEAVKDEILNSAKEQSNSLIAEARKEANRIWRETENKIEGMKEKSDEEAKRMIDTIKRQELASADLENKKMLLEAKKQLIDNAFDEARKRLENLDDKKKEFYIKKLLEKAKSDIDISTVYCSKKDAKFLKGFNAETAGIIGGIMAENRDKTIRVDYSFDAILESLKETELQNISRILFG
ncbi:hypothetical protein HYY70_06050 [Candidatus Woesearchaeota archaeon]|nr:hypothetical protein [Candidatus Woesearchaeota archaeon]